MDGQGIKRMKLYDKAERIYNELAEAGFTPDQPLSAAALSAFDSYHYHGNDAVDAAIAALGLGAESRVVEIGAGIGGPARHIAAAAGSRVSAVELQPELHAVGRDLTARCGLDGRIEHICADVLQAPLQPESHDAVVSWLALFHVPDQDALVAKIAEVLRPGGGLFVEDLCRRAPFTAEERALLDGPLFSPAMQDLDRYAERLEGAGLSGVCVEEMTDDWTAYTRARAEAYRRDRERHLRVHGEAVVENMQDFYDMMVRLFEGGNLGGVRVTARKG